MSATAHTRGHPIVYIDGAWCWADSRTPIAGEERPCVKCGLTAKLDGPDPCFGLIPGVSAACCGHGIEAPVIVWDDAAASLTGGAPDKEEG